MKYDTYTLKIVEIHEQTEDARTLCFKQPALKKISYLPGQYMTLILTINNRKYRRAYSFSSAPGIDSTLDITIKRMVQGVVSNHLLDIVKIGDTIEVISPMGEFIYNKETDHKGEVFLWGVGSGITPLMSILKTALHTHKNVTLVYGNREPKQTIFYDHLEKIKELYAENFSLFYFFTKENKVQHESKFFHGRINSTHIEGILNKYNELSDSLHYICGPTEFKNSVKETLLKKSIKSNQIFTEEFEHKVEESQLKEVCTTFVKLKKDGHLIKLEVIKGKSILDAALDQQLDLSYSCQTGTCTLCKATLLSGKVKTVGVEKIPEGLVENERLLCCSYPLTDDIEIEVK